MKFTIHEPIWCGLKIGLAQDKLTDFNEVEIDYINKEGERLYPDTYTITREEAERYPVKKCARHWLRIVPIRELKLKG